MATWISYRGKELGAIALDDNNTGKFIFHAKGLDSLAQLFKIGDEELVNVDGVGPMTYSEFSNRYLRGPHAVTGYYPTDEAWLLKNRPERTVAALDRKS